MYCSICHKQSMRAIRRIKLRGKYNPTAIRHQKPNLQWVHLSPAELQRYGLPLDKKRVKACAKCIKKMHQA